MIRALGGAPLVDYCHYLIKRALNHNKNCEFTKKHPEVSLPPAYLVYESFQMDYAKYYLGGRETANWISRLLQPYMDSSGNRILDWGCGPARVIRHLPQILGSRNFYFGCDYNPETIAWCQNQIQEVSFSLNHIHPPLPYDKDFFNLVYGISIFTHLSEENHRHWTQELHRILRPQGILLLTMHGEAFSEKLTRTERSIFDSGKLVIRSKAKEGQRVFGAFHPPSYLISLFHDSGYIVLEHIKGKRRENHIEQDTWILRKNG